MTTPNQLREEFDKYYDRGHINQHDRNEIVDYWLAKLEEAKKEAVEEGTKAGLMKVLSFKIPKNPCSMDYADGFTACQTLCLNAAHSKDEIINNK